MTVAFFSPLPPSPTGIADYSRLLIDGLRRRVDVEAYTESNASDFKPGPLPIYQMGNSPHHDFIYPFIRRHPGVLVLHDLVLHHARLARYLEGPDVVAYKKDLGNREKRERAVASLAEYEKEMEATYPSCGKTLAEIALRIGGGRILYEYPFFEDLARASRLVLVHSKAACDAVRDRAPGADVRRVRMGIEIPTPVPREEARRRLGFPEKGALLASFGLITPEKRIGATLACIKRLVEQGRDVRYVLVGGTAPHYDAVVDAHALGIGSRVRLAGRVSEEALGLYASASDIALNFRYPSAGETSATVLRIMAAGRPVMVTDEAQYDDFPKDTLVRVSIEGEGDGLFCDVLELLRDPDRRKKIESSARRFIEAEHSPDVMVSDYLDVLAQLDLSRGPESSSFASNA